MIYDNTKGDPNVYPDNNPKTAIGVSKAKLSAIPASALFVLGQAMEDGRRKYGLYNYRDKTVSSSVYYDAGMRHRMSWWDGEDFAMDSLIHHLGHSMACDAILIDAITLGRLNDDRGTPGMLPPLLDEYAKTGGIHEAFLRRTAGNGINTGRTHDA